MHLNGSWVFKAFAFIWSRRRSFWSFAENWLLRLEIWRNKLHNSICKRLFIRILLTKSKWNSILITKPPLFHCFGKVFVEGRKISHFWGAGWIAQLNSKHADPTWNWWTECWRNSYYCNFALSSNNHSISKEKYVW